MEKEAQGCELHGTIRIDMVLKVKQQLG